MKPKAIIMAGYGINCEEETKFVFEKAGASADIIHINDLIEAPSKMEEYQIMVFPGGFSYGDDTGAGNAYANKVSNNLGDDLLRFVQEDKLVLGICNGCQIVTDLGLIPGFDGEYGKREIALQWNSSARYECRWITIKAMSEKSIWTRGVDALRCPISSGEGHFYMSDDVLSKLKDGDQVAFRYVKEDGSLAGGEFPYNPNGAVDDIAAVCDPTGRILAVMPHSERNWNFYNQDDWTLIREKADREGIALPEEGQGMKLFKNAVEYFG